MRLLHGAYSNQHVIISGIFYLFYSADCVQSHSGIDFVGPTRQPTKASDPFIVGKLLNQMAFSSGELIIRPLQEKCMQFVRHDTMVSEYI